MDDNIRINRSSYPCGLLQPSEGFRFSLDPLLLASFSRPRASDRSVADLGCGCGVLGLGLLLRYPEANLQIFAIDLSNDMCILAKSNTFRLGFEKNIEIHNIDILSSEMNSIRPVDMVVINPPYRHPGSGRANPNPEKASARFESGASLEDFVAAASRLLRHNGRLCMVHLPERLADILASLDRNGLQAKRLRFAHGREGKPARIMLLDAVKGGRPGLAVEPPLILRQGQGQAYTAQALAFCPFLQSNSPARPLENLP